MAEEQEEKGPNFGLSWYLSPSAPCSLKWAACGGINLCMQNIPVICPLEILCSSRISLIHSTIFFPVDKKTLKIDWLFLTSLYVLMLLNCNVLAQFASNLLNILYDWTPFPCMTVKHEKSSYYQCVPINSDVITHCCINCNKWLR